MSSNYVESILESYEDVNEEKLPEIFNERKLREFGAFCVVTTQDEHMLVQRAKNPQRALFVPKVVIKAPRITHDDLLTDPHLNRVLQTTPDDLIDISDVDFSRYFRVLGPQLRPTYAIDLECSTTDLPIAPTLHFEWAEFDTAMKEADKLSMQFGRKTFADAIDSYCAIAQYYNTLSVE